MTEQWHPGRHHHDPRRMPPEPPFIPPSPAVAIVALFLGVIGLLATLVPLLRLPGILVGLMAATLGVVAVACRGLGGKTIGAIGFFCGSTAMPVALFLYLASVEDARRVEECLRIFPDQVSACSSTG